MQSIPKLAPICPICNGLLDLVPYNDILTREKGFIAQCHNKCRNLQIKDDDCQTAISKFLALIKYLEQ